MARHQHTGGARRHMRTPRPSRSGSSRLVTLTVAVLVVMTGVFGLFTGAASAATLTKTSWLVNNSQTGKTGVTYAYEFTTATAGTLTSVTMTVPAPTGHPTGGSPVVGTVYGLGAGTVAFTSPTITYTITTPVAVAANIPVFLSFTGITNTVTAGTYTSVITTMTGVSVPLDNVTTTGIVFGLSSTGVTVSVGQTLTFTNSLSTFSLVVDPSMLNSVQSQVVVLTVQTNAASGYVLQASDTGLSRTVPPYTITAVSSGPTVGVATFPATGWGASATLATTGGATLASGFAGGKFVGYPSAAATFVTSTGPTGASADTLTLTDQVGVNYTVPEGSYTDTITYVATPSY